MNAIHTNDDASDRRNQIEGVATSCLMAVAFGFIASRSDLTLEIQQWLWLLFVVLSGLVIAVDGSISARKQLIMIVPCCLIFFSTLIFQNALQIIWRAASLKLLSWPPIPSSQQISLLNAAMWYGFLFCVTLPAVFVAVDARRRLIAGIKALWGLSPVTLSNLEKNVNTSIRIMVLIGAFLLATLK